MNDTQPAAPAMDRADDETRRSVFRSPFLWAFLGGIILLTLMRPLLRHEPAPPPVLSSLPEFRLTASSGEPFGSDDLAGRVYVAGFFFTRCPSICPRLMGAMRQLQRRFDEAGIDGVRLVSITVDPDHDTPERLRAYGAAHGVDPRRWTLLGGDLEAVRRLVVEGFRASFGEPDREHNLVELAHSTKFVLVDGEGRIRGYYDSDATGVDEIFHRAQHVLQEMRR